MKTQGREVWGRPFTQAPALARECRKSSSSGQRWEGDPEVLFQHDGHDGEEEQLQEVVPAAVPFAAFPRAGRRWNLAHGWSTQVPRAEPSDKTGQRSARGDSTQAGPVGVQSRLGVFDVYPSHSNDYLCRRR